MPTGLYYKRGTKNMKNTLDADDYIRAAKRLEKSAGWKYQTQRFLLNRLSEIARLKEEGKRGKYEPQNGSEFIINDGGHRRLVKSLCPRDAVFQHALADEILTPELTKYLIYDNGAGLKGKGISFTRRRLEEHLRWHYRRYGTEGYILAIDFRKYFDNIRHDTAMEEIFRRIPDAKTIKAVEKIFDMYKVDVSFSKDPDIINKVYNSLEYQDIPDNLKTGKRYMRKSLGIGSPISQITGLLLPTAIDNYVKTVKQVHCYNVYMDDRIIIHPDKQFLKELLENIGVIAQELGIHINRKKTQIIKLSHGFTWLKTRYIITDSGKIIKKIPHDIVTAQRRKMKKMARMVVDGEIPLEYFENQYKSWAGGKKLYNAHRTMMNMESLYRRLLEWIAQKKKE